MYLSLTNNIYTFLKECKTRNLTIPPNLREKYLGAEEKLKTLESCRLPNNNKIPEPKIGIEGICYRPGIQCLAGSGKVSKSLAIQQLALSFKTGGSWMGHKTQKLKTLLVDTEMLPRDFKLRGLATEQSEGLDIFLFKNLKIPDDIKRLDPDERRIKELEFKMSMLREYIYVNKIQVLILDCIYKLISDRSPKEVRILLDYLEEYREMDVLSIIVHHITKGKVDANTPLNSIAGHSDLIRAIEGGIVLIREGSIADQPRIRVKYDVRAMAPIKDKIVFLKDGKHILAEKLGIQDARSQEEKLIDVIASYIPASEEKAIPTDEIIRTLEKHDDITWQKSYMEKKLPEWVEKGYLNVIGNRPKCYYQGALILQKN